MAKNIKVTNINGIQFGEMEPGSFDKVLLDAPCSSDRHLIQEDFRHSGWSVKKSRDYAKLQEELLVSALKAAKVGGIVVYSTCTLSPYENDEVVERGILAASKKHNIISNIIDVEDAIGAFDKALNVYRHSSYGALIIPSEKCNSGPMYTSKIERVS